MRHVNTGKLVFERDRVGSACSSHMQSDCLALKAICMHVSMVLFADLVESPPSAAALGHHSLPKGASSSYKAQRLPKS